jgi:putative membrane protein
MNGLGSWSLDPVLVVMVVAAACGYALGLRRLWAGRRGRGVPRRRAVSFFAGLAALVMALMSPLEGLAVQLFSFHMIQHLVLILIVAPLLVYGAPVLVITLALPRTTRKGLRALERSRSMVLLKSVLFHSTIAGALFAVALWSWHLPSLYQSAVADDRWHVLEHSSFVGGSLLFWMHVIGRKRYRLDFGPAILLVFVSGLQSAALSVVLIFAGRALYPIHAHGARAWGLTPLEDQQLAGAIMWTPVGLVFLVTIVVLLARWLKAMDRRRPPTEAGITASWSRQ